MPVVTEPPCWSCAPVAGLLHLCTPLPLHTQRFPVQVSRGAALSPVKLTGLCVGSLCCPVALPYGQPPARAPLLSAALLCAQIYVSLLMLLNMGVALTAEFTAVGDLFSVIIGTVRWPMVVIIGLVATSYTAYGGLHVSIITDQARAPTSQCAGTWGGRLLEAALFATCKMPIACVRSGSCNSK